jgi:HAD superfamily hydrolase (TIGR01490 family)
VTRERRRSRLDDARLAGAASAAAAEVEAALTAPPDSTAAAFFDVDNTMVRGASIFYLARGLARRKLLTTRDIASFAWKQAKFRAGGGEDMQDVQSIREAALSFIAGHRVDELRAVAEEVFEVVLAEKVWPGTHALAQIHLAAGQRVWLVTATPVEIATIIAKRLGLTGALGTVAESEDGFYTGKLVGDVLHGPVKAEAVKALAEMEGLDLARCAAYSDSSNDIPLLSLVGHPCAVNPDATLRQHARSRGWRIRDYRTGRKALKIGLPTAAAAGALVGGMAAGVALRRRYGR